MERPLSPPPIRRSLLPKIFEARDLVLLDGDDSEIEKLTRHESGDEEVKLSSA